MTKRKKIDKINYWQKMKQLELSICCCGTARDSEEQGSLACYRPQDHKELDMTEGLNNNSDECQPLCGPEEVAVYYWA